MNVKFFLICIVSCILVGCAGSAEKQREFRVVHDIGELDRILKRIPEDTRYDLYHRIYKFEKPVRIILGRESRETEDPIIIPYNYEFHEKFKEVMGISTDKQNLLKLKETEKQKLLKLKEAEKQNLIRLKKFRKRIGKLLNIHDEMKGKSSVICHGDVQCKKLFQLTQIFIIEHSTQKIQLVTDTVIETHNPSDYDDIGFRAIKMPLDGTKSRVSITILSTRDDCMFLTPERVSNQYRKIEEMIEEGTSIELARSIMLMPERTCLKDEKSSSRIISHSLIYENFPLYMESRL